MYACLCVYACVNMFDTRTPICECFKAPVVHYLEFLPVTWCLPQVMDWGQCIVCQKKTSEALKCLLKAEGSGDKSGAYVSFMANVNEFKD